VRAFGTWQRALLAIVAAVGALQLAYEFMGGTAAGRSADSPCSIWDREVTATLALDAGNPTSARLDEAFIRLQRARANCRSGRLGLARVDYKSLLAGGPAPQSHGSSVNRVASP
jgi:hypothetical protein